MDNAWYDILLCMTDEAHVVYPHIHPSHRGCLAERGLINYDILALPIIEQLLPGRYCRIAWNVDWGCCWGYQICWDIGCWVVYRSCVRWLNVEVRILYAWRLALICIRSLRAWPLTGIISLRIRGVNLTSNPSSICSFNFVRCRQSCVVWVFAAHLEDT